MRTKRMREQFDIAVVGGGIVGATLAHALADSGCRIALLEARTHVGAGADDERSAALAFTSRRIMRTLGLWEDIAESAAPIKTVHVSQQGFFGAVRLHHHEHGVDALGHVVANRVIESALYERVATQQRLSLYAPVELQTVEPGEQLTKLRFMLEGEACNVDARLLVAADGATSSIRRLLGIGVSRADYAQSAVIANVSMARHHNNVAYERFTSHGPLALLPLPGRRCALVWTRTPADAAMLAALPDDLFLQALQTEFGHRAGRFAGVGTRRVYPLSLLRAARVTGSRAVFVGNAAQTLHPVAGQGLNLALRNIAGLAELVAAAARDDIDIAAPSLLLQYESMTRPDVDRAVCFTDGLARMFTHPLLPFAHARSAGLVVTDVIGPLRRTVARRNMGLGARLPRLACGLPLL
ncbi:MAG: 2-octaprenyl-6-methoxyphenyl hydroxylase [Gammaproteobacteria bacterium]